LSPQPGAAFFAPRAQEAINMISIRNVTTAATTIALSLSLGLGTAGIASAQSATTHPQNTPTQSTSKHKSQEEIDREKVTLKDKAQEQIDAANANIDELQKMGDAKGQTKKQHDDMAKRLSDTRDRLKGDLPKIDDATMNDWTTVRTQVERDVTALNTQLQRASSVTNVPVPQVQSGATNKQPHTR
jgi:TolA-binding protein